MSADTRASRGPGRLLSWAALFVALVYSFAANVAYALPHIGPRLASGAAPPHQTRST